jgi:hypothetical protein
MIDISKPVMIEGRKDHTVTIVDEDYEGKIATIVTCKSGKFFWVFSKSGESEPPGATLRLINAPETKLTYVSLYAPSVDYPQGFCPHPVSSIEDAKTRFRNESLYGRRIGFMKLTWEDEKLVDYEFIKEGEQK